MIIVLDLRLTLTRPFHCVSPFETPTEVWNVLSIVCGEEAKQRLDNR